MIREEHLKYCKVCVNQKFDMSQGVICGLTDSRADFEKECSSFVEDSVLKAKESQKELEQNVIRNQANAGARFVNRLIDYICIWVFSFIVATVFAIVSPDTFAILAEDNPFVNFIFIFVVSMMYYNFFEITSGRTFGKLVTGTKVVDEFGNKATSEAILIRSLCRFIPFDAFSFLGDEASGWHDTISKTKVIKV